MTDSRQTPPAEPPHGPAALNTVAVGLVIAAAAWFLLRQLADVLRPLFLAVFLCNIIVPQQTRLRKRMPAAAALGVIAGISILILVLLALAVYVSIIDLESDLPQLLGRAKAMFHDARDWVAGRAPWMVTDGGADKAESDAAARLQAAAAMMVNGAAGVLVEAVMVAVYLIFLLLEVQHLPDRIRGAFGEERAERILDTSRRINGAISGYLRVKVKAGLMIAVPAALLLWLFGVKFALLWGVLTFCGNFIPYLGSIVACTLPIVFAFLQLDPGWQPIAVAVALLAMHQAMAYAVEPIMAGKAVGLSPLVIFISLAFWGQCWGLVGMLLAVPLTVKLKIVLENVPYTRPIAHLLGEG